MCIYAIYNLSIRRSVSRVSADRFCFGLGVNLAIMFDFESHSYFKCDLGTLSLGDLVKSLICVIQTL